jgi:hypothetical protein
MGWWSDGVVEWWSGGVVEWWSGGVVEWCDRSTIWWGEAPEQPRTFNGELESGGTESVLAD